MLYVHPLFQLTMIMTAGVVFYVGTRRFRQQHLHQKVRFPWKMHVDLGQIALGGLFAGMIGGLLVARLYWGGALFGSFHGKVGLAMVPFILFGFGSGFFMDRRKKKRRILPLLHGMNNVIVLLLALVQLRTGLRMVLGIMFK